MRDSLCPYKGKEKHAVLYQKILSEDKPYHLSLSRLRGFTEHRHADIEIDYCVKGSFEVIIDKTSYRVREGEMALIASGVSHAFPESDEDRLVLTAIVGTSFLKKNFEAFSGARFLSPVCDLKDASEDRGKMRETLLEMVELYRNRSDEQSSLLLVSDLYRLSAYLLSELEVSEVENNMPKPDLRAVANIEKALELIYYDYRRALTIEEAASVTGYGKSNFCRIFKRITGMSFHKALNRRRVQVACGLLQESDLSVTIIAEEVGFDAAKTFCRVFREQEGMTPGHYRKLHAPR